jgi:hypothetical protein
MSDASGAAMAQLDVEGTYVLASSASDKVSLILPDEVHTAFTGRLLRLLKEGVPEGGPLLTMEIVFQQLLGMMHAEGLMTPQRRGSGTAELVAIGRNPAFQVKRLESQNSPAPAATEVPDLDAWKAREQFAGKHIGTASGRCRGN